VGIEGNLEGGAIHRQLCQLFGDPALQFPGRIAAVLAQTPSEITALLVRSCQLAPELLAALLGVLKPLDLVATALGVLEHALERAAVLALETREQVETLL
jgi:hypothetical protein